MQNKRELGTVYEKRVAEYLRTRGYLILEQNFRSRFGEVDIIACKERCIVFVEVKFRSHADHGFPVEAVDHRKRRHICNTASWFLYSRHYPTDTPCRFDVAAVSEKSIELIENAFPYEGSFSY